MTRSNRPITEPRTCDSCGGRILWVTWERSGKTMPVDATPSPSGDILLAHRQAENRLMATKLRRGEHVPESRNRYVSHFDTCPNAKQHRGPR